MNTLILVAAMTAASAKPKCYVTRPVRRRRAVACCPAPAAPACCTPAADAAAPVATPEPEMDPGYAPPPPEGEAAPEAAPAPEKTSVAPAKKSLYERLGGEGAVKAVVDDFVARTAANEKVNFFRKGTDKEWKPEEGDVDKLKVHLVNLVGMLTGGPQKYEGRSMKEAHAGMKITAEEFDAIAGDLKATLDKFKVPEAEQKELLGIVGSTKGDIVEAAEEKKEEPKEE